jgi:hypothetical protein
MHRILNKNGESVVFSRVLPELLRLKRESRKGNASVFSQHINLSGYVDAFDSLIPCHTRYGIPSAIFTYLRQSLPVY